MIQHCLSLSIVYHCPLSVIVVIPHYVIPHSHNHCFVCNSQLSLIPIVYHSPLSVIHQCLSCPIAIHHRLPSSLDLIPHFQSFPIVRCLVFTLSVIHHCHSPLCLPILFVILLFPIICQLPLSSTPIICHSALSVPLYVSHHCIMIHYLSLAKIPLSYGQERNGNPFFQEKQPKQKHVTKYQYCLSSSIVYHSSLSVICHCLSFAIFCQYPLSIIHYFQLFVIAHWLSLPIVFIPHCLSFPTVCRSTLFAIPHFLSFPTVCHSSLFGICHYLSFIYYLSFCISCHFPFYLIPNCQSSPLSII